MSGAGGSPAGVGPAGYDPIGAPSTQRAVTPQDSVQYDPSVRDFAGTTGGYWASVHWVDQAVALALTIERGKLKSVPTQGVRYREIKRLGDDTASQVEDMTREALALLLGSPPKITIISIETQITRGILKIAVTYENLLLRKAQTPVKLSKFMTQLQVVA